MRPPRRGKLRRALQGIKRVDMNVTLRQARIEDAVECGRICYRAFYKINTDHNFPPASRTKT